MATDNNITFTGNLAKPAEVRHTKSGKAVTTLTVGHTPREKRDGEWRDAETIWFKVTVWDALPEILFDRGVRVVVTGTLFQESYDDKEGNKRTSLVVNADSVGLVHRSQNASAAYSEQAAPTWSAPAASGPADEMPF
jgi:single-strand DNA-binding protein